MLPQTVKWKVNHEAIYCLVYPEVTGLFPRDLKITLDMSFKFFLSHFIVMATHIDYILDWLITSTTQELTTSVTTKKKVLSGIQILQHTS